MSWVDVRNFDNLMSDYQKSSMDSTRMPGLGTYMKKLIEQNDRIIELLEKTVTSLENIEVETRDIYNAIG